MTQQFHFWEYIQRKEFGKEYLEKISATPMFIAALFTVAKVWKYPKCPSMDEWIKKLWYMYTMEYYSAVKKEILLLATTQINLENIMLSEISQTQKDKHGRISLTCRI